MLLKTIDQVKWNCKVTENGCWEWKSSRFESGYGKAYLSGNGKRGGKTVYVHRHVLELLGVVIPKGMHVMHLCENPSCCNPDHLRIGSVKENNHHGARSALTAAQAEDVRNSKDIPVAILMKEYDVSQNTIRRIWKGETYGA